MHAETVASCEPAASRAPTDWLRRPFVLLRDQDRVLELGPGETNRFFPEVLLHEL